METLIVLGCIFEDFETIKKDWLSVSNSIKFDLVCVLLVD